MHTCFSSYAYLLNYHTQLCISGYIPYLYTFGCHVQLCRAGYYHNYFCVFCYPSNLMIHTQLFISGYLQFLVVHTQLFPMHSCAYLVISGAQLCIPGISQLYLTYLLSSIHFVLCFFFQTASSNPVICTYKIYTMAYCIHKRI